MARLAESQVFDVKAYSKTQNVISKGGPIISALFGGGPMRRPAEDVSYAGLGSKHASETQADKDRAAKSGITYGGNTPGSWNREQTSSIDARGESTSYTQGPGIGAGTGHDWQKNANGMFNMPWMSGGRGMTEYYSEETGMQGRVTGDDWGPMQMLKEFQGSNRGSGGYVAQIPRYSVAETRKVAGKFNKANFMRLNKHAAKKFLEPGLEQMMKSKAKDFSGSRKVTRKFL